MQASKSNNFERNKRTQSQFVENYNGNLRELKRIARERTIREAREAKRVTVLFHTEEETL